MSAIPDVPTIAESGLPGFETGSWQGVIAPPDTPREIVARLNAEISRILATPEMRDKLGTRARTCAPTRRMNSPPSFAPKRTSGRSW